MARKPQQPKITSRDFRLALPWRRAPYGLTVVAPGVRLGYRRTKSGIGTWVAEGTDGHGKEWQKQIGAADDREAADGVHILDYWQAAERVRTTRRGVSSHVPVTLAAALDAYAKDLKARGQNPGNASVVRHHLQDHSIFDRPVSLLIGKELTDWRNSLLESGRIKTATVLRLCKSLKAALNLAARLDPRIQNRNAWHDGLSGLVDTSPTLNRVLEKSDVLILVQAAYALDLNFGLFIDVLASSGTRTSQACKLTVADLQLGTNGTPRLMMPPSRKGKKKQVANKPVPITPSLAAKLKQAAAGKAGHAPLLTRGDGIAWDPEGAELWKLFGMIATSTGIGGTAYQLRHSAIVRALLANVPIRVVAEMHHTSVSQIEKTYSAFILHHADSVARMGLLDTGESVENNVVSLRGR
jgi:integrase